MKLHSARIAVAVASIAMAVAPSAQAQTASYPTKPITLIVPFPPGGGTDIVGRTIAQKLSEYTGQSIIVENRPGANGAIGLDHVARSAADGYTLAIASATTLMVNPAVRKNLPYDPIKSFVAVANLGVASNLVVVNSKLPVQDIKDLVAYAKKSENPVAYASFGSGSTGQFCIEMIRAATGAPLNHIPYSGSAPAINDMLAGHVMLGSVDLTAGLPHIHAGKLRAIAACTQPTAALPDVKGFKEQGVPYEFTWAWVLVAPTGTPQVAVDTLSGGVKKALGDPAILARWKDFGIEQSDIEPAELTALIQRQITELAEFAISAKIQVD